MYLLSPLQLASPRIWLSLLMILRGDVQYDYDARVVKRCTVTLTDSWSSVASGEVDTFASRRLDDAPL